MVQVAVKLKCLDSDSTVQEKDVSPQKGHKHHLQVPLLSQGNLFSTFLNSIMTGLGFFF